MSVQEKGSWEEPHDLNGRWPWRLWPLKHDNNLPCILPRLSIQSPGQEGEPPAPAQRALHPGDKRREADRVDTQARVKGKINCKQKI